MNSQTNNSFVDKGLLKATATISPGFMLNHPITNIYVSGELEYFLEKRISVRGDGLWYRDSQENIPLLKQNSLVYFGALYHFSKNKHDLFLGLQPGFSITQPNLVDTLGIAYPIRINPSISIIAGYTFYVWDYCNFFINARYHNTKNINMSFGALNLDEIILSAGLGFQLHTKLKNN
jgi:hypothetical protein